MKKKNRDDELHAEIQSHLDMAIADRIERGEDPREAAAAPRRPRGNLGPIQEATPHAGGGRWVE
jgi:hypothetical protein